MAPRKKGSRIKWNEVTWYSKLLAGVLFLVIIPELSFYIGAEYAFIESTEYTSSPSISAPLLTMWQAYTDTAFSITGDVILSPNEIIFTGNTKRVTLPPKTTANAAGLSIAFIGSIENKQSYGLNYVSVSTINLYKITDPQNLTLIAGNSLCGDSPAQYLALAYSKDATGRRMDMAVFNANPTTQGNTLCGTFGYYAQ